MNPAKSKDTSSHHTTTWIGNQQRPFVGEIACVRLVHGEVPAASVIDDVGNASSVKVVGIEKLPTVDVLSETHKTTAAEVARSEELDLVSVAHLTFNPPTASDDDEPSEDSAKLFQLLASEANKEALSIIRRMKQADE